jgi:methyl-accepting chemotaxis protein
MRENTGVRRYYTPVQVGADTWWVHTAVTVKELMKDQNVSILIMSVVQIVTLVLLLLVLSMALKCSLKPLDGMAKLAKGISHGNLSGSFEYPYKDEIGDLVANLQYMAERFRRIIEDLDVQLEELSEGNLSHDDYDESLYEGDFASLHASVANIKEHLNDTLLNIRNVAESVNSGSEQVDAGAQILAQGATEQAASIEELNAEMARIHDGVRDTSKKTTDASDLSHDGNAVIKESNEKMHELTAAMADITEKSNEISKIIKTIDDIAFQTNILALNAAVEAARAGDSGKGFAVVADEVRNLAGKSAKAAKSTAQLIQGALDAVKNGETITVQTAEALERAAKNTEQVTSLVEDIAMTMTEQATAVDTVTIGLDQISSVVQTNSATAEESAAASGELSKQATELNSLIGRFQLKD